MPEDDMMRKPNACPHHYWNVHVEPGGLLRARCTECGCTSLEAMERAMRGPTTEREKRDRHEDKFLEAYRQKLESMTVEEILSWNGGLAPGFVKRARQWHQQEQDRVTVEELLKEVFG